MRQQPIQEAIDSLYETLYSEENPEPPLADPFMEILARGTVSGAESIDERISRKSENWRIERMATVDRNILRLAVYEMTSIKTPGPVVIDEALELARQFSGDEAVSFINGVLDAIYRENLASVDKSD